MGMEFILQEPKPKVLCTRQKPPNSGLLLVYTYFLTPPSHWKTTFTHFLNISFKITFKETEGFTPSLSHSSSAHMKKCTLFFAKTACKMWFTPLHLYPYLVWHTLRSAPFFSPRMWGTRCLCMPSQRVKSVPT